ncbi:hypothetical protein EDC04DRAFT_2600919 [Pisolithus marmoratus]|nr:hypothetical protein EDC04DRAFT_2600919 [Pisolithus marmoratus]
MRLLSVRGVLDRESDITKGTEDTFRSTVVEELDDTTTDYAMLSHRWSNKEVNYSEMVKLTSMSMEKRDGVGGREGYNKILEGFEQAVKDGLERLWVDTCCIDKRRSSELSEAINSMYQWYYSTKCYAHLHDFTESTFPNKPDKKTYGNCNGRPEWFSWGWTLQELIAPKEVQFFNKDWVPLGNKRTLAFKLAKTTRIPLPVLKDRKTTRVEDRAYSLLGLFGVNMPMLYGEGGKAFQRLQLEIIRGSSDHSIFAWGPAGSIRCPGSVLADDPSYFRDCDDVRAIGPDEFVKSLKENLQSKLEAKGVKFFGAAEVPQAIPDFRQVYLACYRDRMCRNVTLDDTTITYYGFTRCGAFPCVLIGNSIALSALPLADDLVVVIYTNDKDVRIRFAVALGCCRGQRWVHIVCDDTGGRSSLWEDYAKNVYERLWNARAEYARNIVYSRAHDLILDGMVPRLLECVSQKIPLGDYGDWDHISETLTRDGNVFEDLKSLAPILGIDPTNSAYCPAERTTHALSARINDKYLVTTVVQCSAYHADYRPHEWIAKVIDHDGSEHSESSEPQNVTVLRDIAKPHSWDRDATDKERREHFKEIKARLLVTTEDGGTLAVGTQDDEATKDALDFFSNIFGIRCLENFVGDIAFFKNLESISEFKSGDGPLSVAGEEHIPDSFGAHRLDGLPQSHNTRGDSNEPGEAQYLRHKVMMMPVSLKIRRIRRWLSASLSNTSEVAQDPRIEALTTRLLKIIRTDGTPFKPHHKRKIKRKAVSISKTLNFGKYISFKLYDMDNREKMKYGVNRESSLLMLFELRQIMSLQEKLDTVNNDDEQRALEEDITGKTRMLSTHLSWPNGIHQEVKHIPMKANYPLIMYRIIMEEVPVEQTKMRLHALRDMREIFLKAFAKPVNDAQAHLRRIMADAGAGILKYDLLCSARTKLNLEGPSAATSAHEFQPASVTGGSKRQSTGMVNTSATERSLETE